MWRWRKKRPEVPPEGVRIQRRDGTFVECDMLRDPDLDDRGCAG